MRKLKWLLVAIFCALILAAAAVFFALNAGRFRVDRLVGQLGSKDESVRGRAMQELTNLTDPKDLRRLIYHLGDNNPETAGRITTVLTHMGERGAKAAVAELERLADEVLAEAQAARESRLAAPASAADDRRHLLHENLNMVLRYMGQDAVEELVAMTKSPNPYARDLAFGALKCITAPELFDLYMAEVRDPAKARPDAFEGLGILRQAHLLRLRRPGLADGKEEAWREYAKKSMAAVEPLLAQLDQHGAAVGPSVIFALTYYVDDQRITDKLLALAENSFQLAPNNGRPIAALRFSRDKRVLDILLAHLSAPACPFKDVVRETLVDLPDERKVKALVDVYKSTDVPTTPEMEQVLASIYWRDPFGDEAAERQRQAEIRDEAEEARKSLAEDRKQPSGIRYYDATVKDK